MISQRFSCYVLLTAIFVSGTAHADWAWLKEKAGAATNAAVAKAGTTSLSETKIADGLKEALKVGIDKTIAMTSKTDGFFGNKDIKIPVPEKLQMLDRGLRAVGFGPKMDEFVLSMNRAAEQASPLARDVFIDAIMGMTITDAQNILKGSDTAATEYFKGKTREQLSKAFSGSVTKKLNEVGVTRQYSELVAKYKTLPLSSKFAAPDINAYVVNKSLDGLFKVLGQQEAQIRNNPSARVSGLLKEVFGHREK